MRKYLLRRTHKWGEAWGDLPGTRCHSIVRDKEVVSRDPALESSERVINTTNKCDKHHKWAAFKMEWQRKGEWDELCSGQTEGEMCELGWMKIYVSGQAWQGKAFWRGNSIDEGTEAWNRMPSWVTSLSLFTFLHWRMHWRRKWQPTPVFLPGESWGRGSLVGCHLWGRTESDTTEATQQQQQQQHYKAYMVSRIPPHPFLTPVSLPRGNHLRLFFYLKNNLFDTVLIIYECLFQPNF